MKVNGVICASCGNFIYSRARHDMHYCSCGETFIDGGGAYMRVGFKTMEPTHATFDVEATKEQLYDDWNTGTDKFGEEKP